MSQGSSLIDALSSACWKKKEKKRKEKWPGAFFPWPEAGHALLAVPGMIFAALRYS
jgi:hypothetical protein